MSASWKAGALVVRRVRLVVSRKQGSEKATVALSKRISLQIDAGALLL